MKKFIYFLVLFISFSCVILIFSAPILLHFKSRIGFLIYFIFSPLCHQIPERSFHIFGFQMAVCSRCTGIYFGLFVGALIYPLLFSLKNEKMPSLKTFILLSLPMGIDVFGNILNFWFSSNIIRSMTGLIFGIILPFYLIPALMEITKIKKIKFSSLRLTMEEKYEQSKT